MTRAEALLEASEADETLLLSMIQFKGSRGRRNLIIVEGHDDVTFIDSVLVRYNPSARDVSAIFNSKGKGNVLILFDLINESLELTQDEYWFLVDADFDGMRGRENSDRLWVTPTYSFENLLVSQIVIDSLLSGEYRCNDALGVDDLEKIKSNYFEQFLASHRSVLRFANLCAYYCIKTKTATHSHDSTITRHISTNFPDVTLAVSEEDILRRMPKNGELDRSSVESLATEFSELDPTSQWRGKFLFAGFISFMEELKKDRGSRVPKYFSSRQNMSFNPRTDSIRAMTTVAQLPESLITFVRSISS